MSLATRCTACGTVFRVVQDQLKVSEGWVRCGRCSEIFNALEALFDLDRDTPPDAAQDAPHQVSNDAPHDAAALDVELPTALAEEPALVDKIDAQLSAPHEWGVGSTPATRINERDRLEFPDAQFDSDMLPDESPPTQFLARDGADTDEADIALPIAPPPPPVAPEFVRHAQRQARWQSPKMLALQGAVFAVLLIALGLQAAHQFRDTIAARWPAAAPALAAWCEIASCRIEPARRIEDVVVESTALTRAAAPDAFKLAVVLRNRGSAPVMLPSIDLSLTDATGQLVARRMLSAADFRVAAAPMKPGAESPLQLLLTAGTARVTGYTVEVFYP